MRGSGSNVVVFDLDETLGHFSQLSRIWKTITGSLNILPSQLKVFYSLMDIFPEYSRPGIEEILRFIMAKKHERQCDLVMIYTNNNGPKDWATTICQYYEKRIEHDIFDRVIGAFMVGDKVIEPERTTHHKTYEDLLKCTQLPNDTKICFIDDRMHPLMRNDKVYFIKIKPYVRALPYTVICDRLKENKTLLNLSQQQLSHICDNLLSRSDDEDDIYEDENVSIEMEVDIIVGKQILNYLETFFKKHGRKYTRKARRRGNLKRTRRRQ